MQVFILSYGFNWAGSLPEQRGGLLDLHDMLSWLPAHSDVVNELEGLVQALTLYPTAYTEVGGGLFEILWGLLKLSTDVRGLLGPLSSSCLLSFMAYLFSSPPSPHSRTASSSG